MDYAQIATKLKEKAQSLGLLDGKVAPCTLPEDKKDYLKFWLTQHYQGKMTYLQQHGTNRTQASYVLPEAKSIFLVALPYWHESFDKSLKTLNSPEQAYISRYALGRDYHKVLRGKLKTLGKYLTGVAPEALCRAVVDSAPLSEVAFASLSGLGWQGKNTLLLQKNSGSLFFLGALVTNLPLPLGETDSEHCGSCNRCIQACPTGAIIAPYTVDARRCLSYQTIESSDLIDEPFRKAMGNRIYGCDDCQLVCPFNRFAPKNKEADFYPRHQLDNVSLLALLNWDEQEFQTKMAGSPIYRIGYIKWLSNIIIALGNTPKSDKIITNLQPYLNHSDAMILEAARWSLRQHNEYS